MPTSMPNVRFEFGQTGIRDTRLYRSNPSLITADLDGWLRDFGVITRKPVGNIWFRRESDGRVWQEVGRLTFHIHTELVEVHPHRGITEAEMAALRGAGACARLTEPTYLNGWAFARRKGEVVWESMLYLAN
ncbi:hypothetical protein ACFRAQ_35630 [Nocardia sp. NPDC056611]|uniref:hypothetical protein n=1 Tax=Nocardia sp. NPDC056611 TaxID=3345877 RepID=UPI00366D910D